MCVNCSRYLKVLRWAPDQWVRSDYIMRSHKVGVITYTALSLRHVLLYEKFLRYPRHCSGEFYEIISFRVFWYLLTTRLVSFTLYL